MQNACPHDYGRSGFFLLGSCILSSGRGSLLVGLCSLKKKTGARPKVRPCNHCNGPAARKPDRGRHQAEATRARVHGTLYWYGAPMGKRRASARTSSRRCCSNSGRAGQAAGRVASTDRNGRIRRAMAGPPPGASFCEPWGRLPWAERGGDRHPRKTREYSTFWK